MPENPRFTVGRLEQQNKDLIAEVANLRTQLLQMQSVAHYLDETYYVPMTGPLWRRLWFALWVKRSIHQKHTKKGK